MFLILHGGGGPKTVLGFAEMLAARGHRVLAPTHPGFEGTERPPHLDSVTALARHCASLALDDDVTVLGNSLGGWVAAEMALLDDARIRRAILVNAVGIDVPEQPIADVSKLTPAELAARAWHRPPPAMPAAPPGPNLAALRAYAGDGMSDPTLRARLAKVKIPVQVVWGESDRIVTPGYGRAFAAAIPGATFTLIPEAGHLPQLEAPERLLAAIM